MGGRCGLDASDLGEGQWQTCVHDSEPAGSIKGGEFLDYVNDS